MLSNAPSPYCPSLAHHPIARYLPMRGLWLQNHFTPHNDEQPAEGARSLPRQKLELLSAGWQQAKSSAMELLSASGSRPSKGLAFEFSSAEGQQAGGAAAGGIVAAGRLCSQLDLGSKL
jgi:hypothetical protein